MSAQTPRGLTVLDHPLIRHKMALLRAASTTSRDFKQLVGEIAALMTYEVTRDLPTAPVEVVTPFPWVKANKGG